MARWQQYIPPWLAALSRTIPTAPLSVDAISKVCESLELMGIGICDTPPIITPTTITTTTTTTIKPQGRAPAPYDPNRQLRVTVPKLTTAASAASVIRTASLSAPTTATTTPSTLKRSPGSNDLPKLASLSRAESVFALSRSGNTSSSLPSATVRHSYFSVPTELQRQTTLDRIASGAYGSDDEPVVGYEPLDFNEQGGDFDKHLATDIDAGCCAGSATIASEHQDHVHIDIISDQAIAHQHHSVALLATKATPELVPVDVASSIPAQAMSEALDYTEFWIDSCASGSAPPPTSGPSTCNDSPNDEICWSDAEEFDSDSDTDDEELPSISLTMNAVAVCSFVHMPRVIDPSLSKDKPCDNACRGSGDVVAAICVDVGASGSRDNKVDHFVGSDLDNVKVNCLDSLAALSTKKKINDDRDVDVENAVVVQKKGVFKKAGRWLKRVFSREARVAA